MQIRILSLKDLPAVYQMDQVCFPPGIAFPEDVFEYCLSSPDCLGLGIYEQEALLGFIIVQALSPSSATILTIEVDEKRRGQGLADRLMEEMEKRLKKTSLKRITLQVGVDNMPALSLYRKWGYAHEKRLPDYYGPGLHALYMRKEL